MASTWGPAPSTSELETMWRALCLSTFLTHMLKVNKHFCLKLLRPGLVCCEAIATETTDVSPRMTLLELKACGDTLGEAGITGQGQQLILQPRLAPLMSHLLVQTSQGLFSGGLRVPDGQQQPNSQCAKRNKRQGRAPLSGQVTGYRAFLAMLWTAACQAPLSTEFPRQEYCSGVPFPFSRRSS